MVAYTYLRTVVYFGTGTHGIYDKTFIVVYFRVQGHHAKLQGYRAVTVPDLNGAAVLDVIQKGPRS